MYLYSEYGIYRTIADRPCKEGRIFTSFATIQLKFENYFFGTMEQVSRTWRGSITVGEDEVGSLAAELLDEVVQEGVEHLWVVQVRRVPRVGDDLQAIKEI